MEGSLGRHKAKAYTERADAQPPLRRRDILQATDIALLGRCKPVHGSKYPFALNHGEPAQIAQCRR